MLKTLTIRKSNKKIEAVSDGENVVSDIFTQKEVDLTQEQLDQISNSSESFYDKSLVCVKDPNEDRKEKLNKIIEDLDSATTVAGMKKEILNLINIIR